MKTTHFGSAGMSDYTKHNDDGKGYLTLYQSLNNYYTKTEVDGKGYLKTINLSRIIYFT